MPRCSGCGIRAGSGSALKHVVKTLFEGSLADATLTKEAFAYVIAAKGGAAPAAIPGGAAMKKAAAILFPKVDLHEATLSDTVDFLRAKSKPLDPDGLGVNLILKPHAGGANQKVTLSLNNVPLIEVIKYVTQIAGCEFIADDHAITIRPSAK